MDDNNNNVNESTNTRGSSRRFGVGKTNAFDIFNIIFFLILGFIMVYPIWSVLMTSLITPSEAAGRFFIPWPRNPTLNWYRFIFITDRFPRSFLITTAVTIASTIYTLIITSTFSYALTKKSVPGYKFFIAMITATMFFTGGIIPYFMMMRDLNLVNTLWPLIIGSIGFFNFVMIRAFLSQIPDGLEESAVIDGANEITIFFRIIIPLALPILAVVTLWTAVGTWNAWFGSMLYLPRRPDLHVLQHVLRQLIVDNATIEGADIEFRRQFEGVHIWMQGVQMAAVIVATAPILVVYPFLQKYFVKGIYLGSMKG